MRVNREKEQRQELLKKLNSIRSFIAEESNATLLKYIDEIEREITSKRYGLVFEEYPEKADHMTGDYIPVLREEKKLCIHDGRQMNALIEGDNLAALKVLGNEYQKSIDLIIIDPPYNRGRNDLRYHDRFANENDIDPHSRWLSFMKRRLKQARKLLAADGYIFINIDEHELAQLKLLCDDIFGEGNFVGIYMWEKTSTPSALSRKIRKRLEYILCYAKKLDAAHRFSYGEIDGEDAPLLNKANTVKTLTFPEQSVRFHIPDGIYETVVGDRVSLEMPVVVKNGTNQNKLVLTGAFKWKREMLQKEIEKGTTFVVRSKKFLIRYLRKDTKRGKTPTNLLDRHLGIGTNETATRELEQLGLKPFNYSKPTSLYTFLIKMVNKENMTVLDFFAGSGTTGEAVLRVNKETGSHHRFILCTNNQDKICEGTAYERIRRVIEREDYPAGLQYFKVD